MYTRICVYVLVVGVGGRGTMGRQDGSKHIVCQKLITRPSRFAIWSFLLFIVWKWALFDHFDPHFDPWGAPKRVKIWSMQKMNATIEFPMWNYIYVQIWSFLLLFVGKWALFDHFDPHLTPGVPQKGSNFEVCQKWMPPSNFPCEITYLCKFSVSIHNF